MRNQQLESPRAGRRRLRNHASPAAIAAALTAALVVGAVGVPGLAMAQETDRSAAAVAPSPETQAQQRNARAEAQENAGAPTKPAATPAPEGTSLQEVVVTAQFRAENLQKTPLSITAVNAAQLENRSYTNILDVAQSAPNVSLTQGGGGFGNTNFAFIRGIGQPDFSFAFEPRVGFYIDDVYYATTFGSIFDLLDVDRVEIERGPQGVLNGRNSVGGAIRIFTQKPNDTNSGYVEATAGDYSRFDIKGAINWAVVPDKLMIRLSAGEQRRDGYVKLENFACEYPSLAGNLPALGLTPQHGCADGALGGANRYETKAQVRFLLNEKVEDNLSADFTNDKSEAPADTQLAISATQNPALPGGFGVPAGAPNGLALWLANQGVGAYGLTPGSALLSALGPHDPYTSTAIFQQPGLSGQGDTAQIPNINSVKTYGLSNVLDVDLPGGIHFKDIVAYREFTGAFGVSQSAIALPTQLVYDTVGHHQFSEEARFLGQLFDGRVEWTLGAFYLSTWSIDRAQVDDEGFGLYIPGLGELQDFFFTKVNDTATVQNVSGYGNAEIHLTDKLLLSAGVRYSTESKNYHYDESLNGLPSVVADAPATSIARFDPRLALQYQFTPQILGYVSYSTGFTAGGYDPRPFAPSDINLTIAPENVKAYEVGLKTELFDRRLRLNVDGFYTDYTNIQLSLAGCPVGCPTTSPFYYGNGGNARIQGFEAEAEAQPIRGLLINASVGYTDFKYKSLNPAVNPLGDPTGLTLNSPDPYSPKWTANVGVQYEIGIGPWGSLTPRIDYSYRSTVYFGADPNDPYGSQPSYSLVNARLTWRAPDGKLSVAAFVTNLGDTLYYTGKADELNSFGTATGTIAPPREFGVTLRRAF